MSWSEKIENLKLFIETKGSLPSWKSNRELKIFINKNTNNQFGKESRKMWNIFTNDEKYVKYFTIDLVKYTENVDKLSEFVLKHGRKPKSKSNIEEFKLLKFWRKFKNRNTYIFYNNGEEVKQLYMNFLKNPEINVYYIRDFEKWNAKFNKLKEYLKNNNNILPKSGKILFWFNYQRRFCYKDNLIYSDIMIRLWREFYENFKSN